jgi:hypothetical protein
MGGYGSGTRSLRKLTVEECRALDIARLPVSEFAKHLPWPTTVTWSNYAGEIVASVGYTCEPCDNDSAVLHFRYAVTHGGERSEIDEPIRVGTTLPYFGGVRWWFICPLTAKGRICQRRVRKLYLPSGGKYFGCRTCYDLTYDSVRTHDNRIGHLIRNPTALLKAVKSRNQATSFLGLKACFKVRGLL